MAEITRESAEDFAKRHHPDKFEEFLRANATADYPVFLDFENVLTGMEHSAAYQTLMAVAKVQRIRSDHRQHVPRDHRRPVDTRSLAGLSRVSVAGETHEGRETLQRSRSAGGFKRALAHQQVRRADMSHEWDTAGFTPPDPNSLPTIAVMPMASAPQKATRTDAFSTGAPPWYAPTGHRAR